MSDKNIKTSEMKSEPEQARGDGIGSFSAPGYLVIFQHCQERAMTRFNMNLSLTAYFEMVNGKIPSVIVGERPSRGKGRAYLVQYAGIPGTWLRRGRWVLTCWDGKIG